MQEPWSATPPTDPTTRDSIGQPVHLLGAGVAAILASVLITVLGDRFLAALPRHVLAWFLASIVGFSFAVLYRRETERRRHAEPAFEANPAFDHAATGILLVGIALAGVNAWLLATDLAS